MLFLVKGPLRHEAMWRAWFERAQGLLPAQAVSNALCASEDGMPAALAACSSLASPPSQAGAPPGVHSSSSSSSSKQPGGPPAASSSSSSRAGSSLRRWLYERWHPSGASRAPGVLDRQHLFDVYVHPHPNFTGGLHAAAAGASALPCRRWRCLLQKRLLSARAAAGTARWLLGALSQMDPSPRLTLHACAIACRLPAGQPAARPRAARLAAGGN